MKAIIFIQEILKKFPFLVIANIVLLVLMSVFGICSLFTVSPIVDFLIHPDLAGISPLTAKAIEAFRFFGLAATLGNWLTVFIIFMTLSSLFHIFAGNLLLKTKYTVLRDIMLGMFKDFFNTRWHFFTSEKQGELINTFNRELTVVGGAFGEIGRLFASAMQMLFFVAIPFYISWQVTVISLGVAALFALPFILAGKYSYRWGLLSTTTANQLNSVIQENLSLAKIVLGFGNQRASIDKLAGAFDAHTWATLRSQVIDMAIPILYRPLGVIMMVVALFAARRFGVPLSEMTVLLLALLQITVSVGNMAKQKNSLDNFFPSYEQIKALRLRAGELRQVSGTRQFEGFQHGLLIEKLFFSYPGRAPVLAGINARIPKGKMVAFVGGSGVGKSTFIDIIMGFHPPTTGRIMFDGVSLNDFDIHSYRQRIGYVPQDSVLFNTTIRDNLLWGCKSATDEELRQACRRAYADEFIKELSEGYDTTVGDRGVRLSGGQVQRVALARAILRKPVLLILDEATSSLDTYSERLIQRAIEDIAKETTVIVIAHRLSTIVNADYIYVLKEGRIAEEGTYSELVQMNGHFNHMVELQALEGAK